MGTILAGVALLWVATRPSLNPQPYSMPPAQDALSASEGHKPASDKSARAPGQTHRSRPRVEANDLLSLIDRPAATRSPDLTVRDGNQPDETTRFHVVRAGETLSSIAQQYYGSSNAWRRILDANKTIKDANKIAPGTKLIVPE